MTYQDFNRRVFDFYMSRAQGDYCYLSLDDNDMAQISGDQIVPKFPLLATSWYPLLTKFNDLPQYFGLIGIQCYAAFLMEKEKDINARAYKIRLRQLLGLQNDQELHRLFSADNGQLSIQEEIWQTAQAYFKNELGLLLEIPIARSHAGRYIQYPISQCLLNKEDVRWFTLFFYQHFQPGENIPFAYFKKVFNEHDLTIKKTPHSELLLADPMTADLCMRQLYASFNNWTGEISINPAYTPQQKISIDKRGSQNTTILLIFDHGTPRFYMEDKNAAILFRELHSDWIGRSKNKQWVDGNTLFFQAMEYFQNEYESSRFFDSSQNCYILIDVTISSIGSQFLEQHCQKRYRVAKGLVLYFYEAGKTPRPYCFARFKGTQNQVSLSGGLRLDRKREYLEGFGPTINAPSNYFVLYNNKRHNYLPDEAGSGSYIVRVAGYRDVRFKITSPIALGSKVASMQYGWNLTLYAPDVNPMMEGCLLRSASTGSPQQLNRRWVNSLTAPGRSRYSGRHSLLRMLNFFKR